MKDLDLLWYFLGIKVASSPNGYLLCQSKYSANMLDHARLKDNNIVETPLEMNALYSPSNDVSLANSTSYSIIVGSLVYFFFTDPDIAHVVHTSHFFPSTPSFELHCYSDVDWAGDPEDRKSPTAPSANKNGARNNHQKRVRFSSRTVFKVISWPPHLVFQLADEVAALLMCLMSTDLGDKSISTYLLAQLCFADIDLVHFHQNRIKILENVKKVVVEVCLRAFKDILNGGYPVVVPSPVYPHVAGGFPQLGFGENLGPGSYFPRSHKLAQLLEDPSADLSEIFGGLQLVDGCEDELDVPPDDRTIFLTFSRGYCIAKIEIQEFFTRIFGQCIEDIYMQEMQSDAKRLEKVAEEFIKKQVKEGKKQAKGGESAAKKYVEKYVKDS
ncbi:hypothetical protein AgCh_039734 [Apium graveolens]